MSQVAYQEDIHTFSVDVKRFNIKLPAVFLYKDYLLYNTNDRFCVWKPGTRETCFPFRARLVRKYGNSLLVIGEDLATIYLVNPYPSPVISKEFRLRSGKVWEDEDWFAGNYKKFLFHPLLLTYKKNIFYVKKDNEGRFKVCKLSVQEDAFKEFCLPLGKEEVVSLKPVSTTKVLAAVKYKSIKTVDFRKGKVFSYPDYPIVYQGENSSGYWYLFSDSLDFVKDGEEAIGLFGGNGFFFVSPQGEAGRVTNKSPYFKLFLKKHNEILLTFIYNSFSAKNLVDIQSIIDSLNKVQTGFELEKEQQEGKLRKLSKQGRACQLKDPKLCALEELEKDLKRREKKIRRTTKELLAGSYAYIAEQFVENLVKTSRLSCPGVCAEFAQIQTDKGRISGKLVPVMPSVIPTTLSIFTVHRNSKPFIVVSGIFNYKDLRDKFQYYFGIVTFTVDGFPVSYKFKKIELPYRIKSDKLLGFLKKAINRMDGKKGNSNPNASCETRDRYIAIKLAEYLHEKHTKHHYSNNNTRYVEFKSGTCNFVFDRDNVKNLPIKAVKEKVGNREYIKILTSSGDMILDENLSPVALPER